MSTELSMSFIEHLVELRKRLIVCVIALIIGMGISWNFSGPVLDFVEKPLTGKTYLTEFKHQIYSEVKVRYPELFKRFELEKELKETVRERQLNYSAPLEPFFVQMKISLVAGVILSLPVIFHQIWVFVAPGLTRKEKRLVVPFVTLGTLSFCIGALFFLIIIWPVIINFSLSYEAEGLRSWFNLTAYINFCMRLILIFGLMFELPVAAMLLSRIGLVTGKMLAGKRRYALLASSIIAAFHADLITMFVIMVPLYLMYEVSIWVAYLCARPRQTEQAAET